MKLLLAALLATGCAPVWAAPVRVQPPVRVAPAAPTPLLRLGAVLAPALSLPPSAIPTAPGLVPAALQPARAEALLMRAGVAPSAKDAEAPAAAEASMAALESVNAVFKDFTPEELAKMPEEKLQALAGVVMDGLDGKKGGEGAVEAVTALAEKRTGLILASRGKMTETLLNPGHPENHGDMIDVRGTPDRVKPVNKPLVYRHYTTPEGLQAILKSNALWNGFLPYVELAPGVFRKSFADVTGLFLTLPGVEGRQVGVPSSDFKAYVDLELPAGLPVLEVEKDAIFLMPLPARARDWVRTLYRRWMKGEKLQPHEEATVRKVDAEGGPGPDLSVPIKIVGHGKL